MMTKGRKQLCHYLRKSHLQNPMIKTHKKPVMKASICNGEQVAGFKDLHTGKFEEVMLICSAADLDAFRAMYGITEEITKEY